MTIARLSFFISTDGRICCCCLSLRPTVLSGDFVEEGCLCRVV